ADNGVILEHYGDILFKNGDLEEALKYWEQALSTEDEISGVLEGKIRLMQYIPEYYMNFRVIIYISFIWLLMCFASSCITVKRAVPFGKRNDLRLNDVEDLVKDKSV